MSKAKMIVLGVAMILAAIGGAVVAFLDNDPATTVDPAAVVEQVKQGVETIREATDAEDVVADESATGAAVTDTANAENTATPAGAANTATADSD